MKISFQVYGKPTAKGRPIFGRAGKFMTVRTPEKTVIYENLVKIEAKKSMGDFLPSKKPLLVEIMVYIQTPKSWSLKKRNLALCGTIKPTTRPDIDNYAKIVLDALNGICWDDDSQVCTMNVIKSYSDVPSLEAYISDEDFNV